MILVMTPKYFSLQLLRRRAFSYVTMVLHINPFFNPIYSLYSNSPNCRNNVLNIYFPQSRFKDQELYLVVTWAKGRVRA